MAKRGKRKSKKIPAKSRKVKSRKVKPSFKRLRIPRGYPGAGRFVSRELLEAIRFEISEQKARQKALRIKLGKPEDIHHEMLFEIIREVVEFGYDPQDWSAEMVFLGRPRRRKKTDLPPLPWFNYQIVFSHPIGDVDILTIADIYYRVLHSFWTARSRFMIEILIGDFSLGRIDEFELRSLTSSSRDIAFMQLDDQLEVWGSEDKYLKNIVPGTTKLEAFALGISVLARQLYEGEIL